tara:strand:+ start:257 stop:649 length:393 start_codon:yes stop_codon:yes gene_type:complete
MNIKKIKLDSYGSKNGLLSVIESKDRLPFNIKRVFFINGDKNSKRGCHAHKKCTQFFLCLNKKIRIEFDDGKNKKICTIKNNNVGLLVPPKIWSSQIYLEKSTIMAVFCNLKYDENEYIRNYDEFLRIVN